MIQIFYDEERGFIGVHTPTGNSALLQRYREEVATVLVGMSEIVGSGQWASAKGFRHALPVGDIVEHSTDGITCHCRPAVDFAGEMVIHSAMDGRTPFEKNPRGVDGLWQIAKGK